MKLLAVITTCLILSAAHQPFSSARRQLEGHWVNGKHSVIVKIDRCGLAWCGSVVQATEAAKQRAREGGTASLIGTLVLTNVRSTGGNTFKGSVFDPKRDIRAPATLHLIGLDVLSIRGCLLGGLICKEQRWTRIN